MQLNEVKLLILSLLFLSKANFSFP